MSFHVSPAARSGYAFPTPTVLNSAWRFVPVRSLRRCAFPRKTGGSFGEHVNVKDGEAVRKIFGS